MAAGKSCLGASPPLNGPKARSTSSRSGRGENVLDEHHLDVARGVPAPVEVANGAAVDASDLRRRHAIARVRVGLREELVKDRSSRHPEPARPSRVPRRCRLAHLELRQLALVEHRTGDHLGHPPERPAELLPRTERPKREPSTSTSTGWRPELDSSRSSPALFIVRVPPSFRRFAVISAAPGMAPPSVPARTTTRLHERRRVGLRDRHVGKRWRAGRAERRERRLLGRYRRRRLLARARVDGRRGGPDRMSTTAGPMLAGSRASTRDEPERRAKSELADLIFCLGAAFALGGRGLPPRSSARRASDTSSRPARYPRHHREECGWPQGWWSSRRPEELGLRGELRRAKFG